MASAWDQIIIHYRDNSGRTASNFFTLADQDGGELPDSFTDLRNAIQEVSDAHVFAVQYQWTNLYGGAPSSGPYCTVQDRAAILGQVGINTVGYDLVAPKADIWMPDNKRLNLLDSRVIDLEAAMAGLLGTQAGVAFSSIKRGTRQWASTRS
jgi:hypothetical protein